MAQNTKKPKVAEKEKLMYIGPNIISKRVSFGMVVNAVPEDTPKDIAEMFKPISEADSARSARGYKRAFGALRKKYSEVK